MGLMHGYLTPSLCSFGIVHTFVVVQSIRGIRESQSRSSMCPSFHRGVKGFLDLASSQSSGLGHT